MPDPLTNENGVDNVQKPNSRLDWMESGEARWHTPCGKNLGGTSQYPRRLKVGNVRVLCRGHLLTVNFMARESRFRY